MNCRISTIGITTAVALLPERGTAESAMPEQRRGDDAEQEHPGEGAPCRRLGRQRDAEDECGDRQQQRRLQDAGDEHLADLADEVR